MNTTSKWQAWLQLRPTWRRPASVLFLITVLNVCLQNDVAAFLKPISEKIQEIQTFREKNRGSTMFNHLSAVSESIPALGWIAVVSPDGVSPLHLITFLECIGESMAPFRFLHPLSVTLKAESVKADLCSFLCCLKFSALCSKMWKVFHQSLQSKIWLQLSSQHLHCFSLSLRHFLSYPIFFSFYAWVMVLFSQSPKPGPYVKEMNDAATFYTNRVLKDYKHRYVPSFTDQVFS